MIAPAEVIGIIVISILAMIGSVVVGTAAYMGLSLIIAKLKMVEAADELLVNEAKRIELEGMARQ